MADAAARSLYVREGLLLLGFVLLIVAAVVSVLVPELDKDPEADEKPSPSAGGAAVSTPP